MTQEKARRQEMIRTRKNNSETKKTSQRMRRRETERGQKWNPEEEMRKVSASLQAVEAGEVAEHQQTDDGEAE